MLCGFLLNHEQHLNISQKCMEMLTFKNVSWTWVLQPNAITSSNCLPRVIYEVLLLFCWPNSPAIFRIWTNHFMYWWREMKFALQILVWSYKILSECTEEIHRWNIWTNKDIQSHQYVSIFLHKERAWVGLRGHNVATWFHGWHFV